MNEAKRVPEMTDQEVIAALKDFERDLATMRAQFIRRVAVIIGSGFIAWVCVGAWLFSR